MNPASAGDACRVEAPAAAVSLAEVAEQAAQAVRTLNHLTRPAAGALSEPGQACDLVAALACTAGRLPQLLEQLSRWLRGEAAAGRLRVDAWSSSPDPAAAVAEASAGLDQASRCVHRAGHALDAAHQALAQLAGPGGVTGQDRR